MIFKQFSALAIRKLKSHRQPRSFCPMQNRLSPILVNTSLHQFTFGCSLILNVALRLRPSVSGQVTCDSLPTNASFQPSTNPCTVIRSSSSVPSSEVEGKTRSVCIFLLLGMDGSDGSEGSEGTLLATRVL